MKEKLYAAFAALFLLASCTSDIQEIKAAQGNGSAFSRALTEKYKAYVGELTNAYDWSHASYFARKGLSASHGDMVLPEDPSKWNVIEQSKTELDLAYQSLTAALDGGARDAKPEMAAIAQVRYDCWVLMAYEGNLPHTSTYTYEDSQYDTSTPNPYGAFACKSAFNSALAGIQK